jgi:hypothetical protein
MTLETPLMVVMLLFNSAYHVNSKRMDGMNNLVHTVQARANRAVEVDSNLGLLCKLIMLRDNLICVITVQGGIQ